MRGQMCIPDGEKEERAAKRALNPLYHQIPFIDAKYLIKCFIYNKWQESCDIDYNNKLHNIKPTITNWPTNYPRKTFGDYSGNYSGDSSEN